MLKHFQFSLTKTLKYIYKIGEMNDKNEQMNVIFICIKW